MTMAQQFIAASIACWNPPPAIPADTAYQSQLTFEMADDGTVADVFVVSIDPETETVKQIVQSFADGATRCLQFGSELSGSITVKVPSLDIFSDNSKNLFD